MSECVRKGIRACTKSCWRRPEQVLATMYSVPWMKSTTSLEQAEECGLKWISWWRKQWFLASRSLDPLPSGSGLLSEAASHHRSDEENLMRRLCVCVCVCVETVAGGPSHRKRRKKFTHQQGKRRRLVR